MRSRLATSLARRATGACLALVLATSTSLAETPRAHELGLYDIMEMLPGHPKVSYFDLLKQIVPDLTADKGGATGRKIGTLRHIAGPDSGAGAPDVIKISSLQALTLQAEGKPVIAILAEIGTVEDSVEQPVVLAIFADSEQPRLLDFVDVGMDRLTGFGEPKLLRIGPNDQAILTHSQHFNSTRTSARRR